MTVSIMPANEAFYINKQILDEWDRKKDDHIAIVLSWGGNVYRERFDQAIFHGKISGLDTFCGH